MKNASDNSDPTSRSATLKGKVPRTKADQSQQTRALILQTGMRCLAKYGYAQTSLHLISKEAGISRGPMSYHFKDPNDLMAAIAEALPKGVSEATRRRLNAAKTLEERLTTVIDIGLEQHHGAHHFVVLELLMAARNNKALAKVLKPHLMAAEEFVDDWWCEYLSLMQWPRERLVAFRTVMVACLRGLSVDYIVHRDDAAHATAIQMVREMLLILVCAPRPQAIKGAQTLGAKK